MAEKTMEQNPLIFGEPSELWAVLRWRDDYGSAGPVGHTWGELQLWVGNTLVWGNFNDQGQSVGVRWSWIDLLEFLGTAWPYLVEEEQYPIHFDDFSEQPRHIGQLLGKAKLRWRKLSDPEADGEDERLRDFLVVHDLAEAFQGAYVPSILLLRQGNIFSAATNRQHWTLGFDATISMLGALGKAISNRLHNLNDVRSTTAVNRWRRRDSIPNTQRLRIATGLDEQILRTVWPLDIDGSNDENYELKAAARMVGNLVDEQQLKHVLQMICTLPPGNPVQLGEL